MSGNRTFDVPDREPDEEDATQRQKAYLKRLADIDPVELAKMGKWQASWLIDQIQDVKRTGRANGEIRQPSLLGKLKVGLIIIFILWIINKLFF